MTLQKSLVKIRCLGEYLWVKLLLQRDIAVVVVLILIYFCVCF